MHNNTNSTYFWSNLGWRP